MLRKVFAALSVLALICILPWATGLVSGQAIGAACACCGDSCTCEDCACDELGCDCQSDGQCACTPGCGCPHCSDS